MCLAQCAWRNVPGAMCRRTGQKVFKQFRAKIAEEVRRALKKYLADGRIGSKDEFKLMCRKLTCV